MSLLQSPSTRIVAVTVVALSPLSLCTPCCDQPPSSCAVAASAVNLYGSTPHVHQYHCCYTPFITLIHARQTAIVLCSRVNTFPAILFAIRRSKPLPPRLTCCTSSPHRHTAIAIACNVQVHFGCSRHSKPLPPSLLLFKEAGNRRVLPIHTPFPPSPSFAVAVCSATGAFKCSILV